MYYVLSFLVEEMDDLTRLVKWLLDLFLTWS